MNVASKTGLPKDETEPNAQLLRTLKNLNTVIADAAFGYAEARHEILTRLTPILTQVADAIVPEVLAQTFGLHLVETLKSRIETELESGIVIRVSPDLARMLEASGQASALKHEVYPDPDLTGAQALITGAGQGQLLDLDALAEALGTALSGLQQTEWKKSNG